MTFDVEAVAASWRPGFAGLTVACVLVLLVCERLDLRAGRWIAKPLASAGFVALGIQAGVEPLMVAALVLCFVGDVCLIPRRGFIAGLAAFLLGHVAYAAAFVARGVDPAWTIATAVGLVVPLLAVAGWLLPEVPAKMQKPVIAYMVVISVMLATAVGTGVEHGAWRVPVAALLFYLSDLCVARERFVAPGFENKLVGLPLYYAAQIMFATA